MRNIRKGQMEIMGLIVVVILLTLGMFFIVSFQTTKPSTEVKESFEDDQLASNFLLSFLKTNAECRTYTMEDLIQDCAVERSIYCNGLLSCDYVADVSDTLLQSTLDVWETDYRFNITGMNFPVHFERNCNSTTERDSAFQPISLYPYTGLVTLTLDVCE